MELGLEGKIALVTGGSEGIGKFTARSLAAEGVKVVICARRPDVLEAAAAEMTAETGGDVTGVQADVTVHTEIEGLFDTLTAAYPSRVMAVAQM